MKNVRLGVKGPHGEPGLLVKETAFNVNHCYLFYISPYCAFSYCAFQKAPEDKITLHYILELDLMTDDVSLESLRRRERKLCES